MKNTDVVVGVDGSRSSLVALRWAATEARHRGASLRVLAAYDVRWTPAYFPGGVMGDLGSLAREQFEEVVAEALAEARAVAPGITVTGSTLMGDPAVELVEAGRSAALVVVGNRGHGGFGSLLLGSVSQRVATHAVGPVAVVRGRAETTGPVVVGVDDSPAAVQAIKIAFEEAMRRGCGLIAAHAFAVPIPPRGVEVPPQIYDAEVLRHAAAESLDADIAPWRKKYPAVPVETLVGRGSPAKILVGVSAGAGLIVVGSRGHGSLAGTLLGSVGLQLLHHAECPVMIVHPRPA